MCWYNQFYLYPGFDLRVCSTSIPPAAGAPYTAASGHETPHARCSVDRRDQTLGRSTDTARAGQLARSRTAGLLGKVRKGSPHLFIKTHWGSLMRQRVMRWTHFRYCQTYRSYTSKRKRLTVSEAHVVPVRYSSDSDSGFPHSLEQWS